MRASCKIVSKWHRMFEETHNIGRLVETIEINSIVGPNVIGLRERLQTPISRTWSYHYLGFISLLIVALLICLRTRLFGRKCICFSQSLDVIITLQRV